jgi:hypothetical protein
MSLGVIPAYPLTKTASTVSAACWVYSAFPQGARPGRRSSKDPWAGPAWWALSRSSSPGGAICHWNSCLASGHCISGSTRQALTERGTREKVLFCPRKVGVHVDHDCGKVVFYDATTSNHLHISSLLPWADLSSFLTLVAWHSDHLESLEFFLCCI